MFSHLRSAPICLRKDIPNVTDEQSRLTFERCSNTALSSARRSQQQDQNDNTVADVCFRRREQDGTGVVNGQLKNAFECRTTRGAAL